MSLLSTANASIDIKAIDAPWANWYWWLEFSDDKWNVIRLLDRNLWATKSGISCTAGDSWACGYHYQWWNNHWFAMNFNRDDSFPNGESYKEWSEAKIDASGFGPWNYYDNDIYITDLNREKEWEWSIKNNDNLWWWDKDFTAFWLPTDRDITDLRWPCPEWYHVPSIWEWNKLFILRYNWKKWWNLENNIYQQVTEPWIWTEFSEDFKIPFAWLRGKNEPVVYKLDQAYLWSATPNTPYAYRLNFSENYIKLYTSYARNEWLSVRCFYDSNINSNKDDKKEDKYDSEDNKTIESLTEAEEIQENTKDKVDNIPELNQAILWMYEKWLTIFNEPESFMASRWLRRDEAAKFYVQYAKQVMWKTPDYSKQWCDFKDLDEAWSDLKDIIVESCQLWLFQWNKWKFMPTQQLTNAQAITVFMRLREWYKDETGSHFANNYYESAHAQWFLFDTPLDYRENFDIYTTRWDVAKMLFRWQKTN